jgi:exopolysaccharide biosynthesis protein
MLLRSCLLWLCAAGFCHAAPWTVEKLNALPSPSGLDFREVQLRSGAASARIHAVTFSVRTHTFALMDDPADAYNLATASQKRGALAAVNGGYFQPDRTPLGLRVRQGQEIHPLERARLLSGLLAVTRDRISLLRVGEFKRTSALREAVQAGPFLVDGGKPVASLNATRPDPRTAIVSDGAAHFGLVSTSSLTLAELGAILATPGVLPDLKIARALNLDGGSSTGLWVAGNPPFYSREFRNVRDFVAIVPR